MALRFGNDSGRLGGQLELVQLLAVALARAGTRPEPRLFALLLVLLSRLGQQVHDHRPPIHVRVEPNVAQGGGAGALGALAGQVVVEVEQHHGVAVVLIVRAQEGVVLLLLLITSAAAARDLLFGLEHLSDQVVDAVLLGALCSLE